MLHDTCEWLVQGYGMERGGAKDTWQSAVATWNGISVPLFPLLGSAAEEDGVPIVPRSWQKAWAHLRPWTPHFKPYERALVWSVASKAASVPIFLSTPRHKIGTPSSSAAEPSSKAEASRKLRLWHQALQTAPAATGWRSTGLEIPAASTADEGPLAPHARPLPPHSNSAVAPGAPKAARRRRLPASFQSSANFDASRFYRETWACFKGLSKVYIGRRLS